MVIQTNKINIKELYRSERYDNLSKYFRMSFSELEENPIEQALLVQTLEGILKSLRLWRPLQSQNTTNDMNVSIDSMISK